jgi:hypothetical protein
MHLGGFADSQIANVEVGQSGGHGWNIDTCGALELTGVRSWYSGRINTGTNGHGFQVRNGATIQITNGFAQENSGNGFNLWGQSGALKGMTLINCNADSDNAAASTWAGFSLNNVEQARLEIGVTKFTGSIGTPFNALSLIGGTTNCNIDLTYHSLGSWPIVGVDVGKNTIRTPRAMVSSGYVASYTPLPYTVSTYSVSLAGPITINNASMSPLIPGWEFTFIFTQDATGGRVVTWGTTWKTAWTPVTTAGKINSITFRCDGTNWIQTSAVVGI